MRAIPRQGAMPSMKFVLFLYIATGAAPITPQSHMLTSQVFETEAACNNAGKAAKKLACNSRVNFLCVPQG